MSEDKKPVQEINPFSMGEIERIHNLMENIPDKDGPNGDSMDLRIWHRDAIKHYEKTKYQLLKTTERLNTILPMDSAILEEIKKQGDDWAIINMSHGTWTKQYILDNWNKDIVMTDDIRHIWLIGFNHFATNNKIKRLEEKVTNAQNMLKEFPDSEGIFDESSSSEGMRVCEGIFYNCNKVDEWKEKMLKILGD